MMRRLVLVATLLCLGTATWAAWWTRTTATFVPFDSPQAIYVGRGVAGWQAAHAYPFDMEPGQWHTITLPYLPDGTVAALLGGLLVNTNTTAGLCNLTATFRAPGSTWHPGNYQMQTLTVPGDGERTNAARLVPIRDKSFEFYWTATPLCPSLINLTMQLALVE